MLLPSSNVTVDRSTIARHLLRWVKLLCDAAQQLSLVFISFRSHASCSDQTDPFNRSPLTMDQIRPNEELKQQISQWLDKRRQERLQLGPSG